MHNLNKINDFYHSSMWIENGIIFGKYKAGLTIDILVARDVINDRKKISKGTTLPLFIDITELLSIDAPARNYMANSEACEFLSAGAIYTKNKLLAFIGQTFILLDRPPIPTKVFCDVEQAMKWLEPFKHHS
jgi:hypothetical protein